MKLQVKAIVPALALALLLWVGIMPVLAVNCVDGTQWTQWSAENKLAYLEGMTNYADFLDQAQKQSQKNYEFCISKVLVDQLKTKTFSQVIEAVDGYYKNPANLNKPVVEAVIRSSTNVVPPGR
jgi:hypothetical protein